MGTIYVMWMRQIKRYLRSKSRMIGAIGQPLLFLVALGYGFGPIYTRAGGGDYIQFIVPGIIGMSILSIAVFSGIEIIWDRQFGFLKETLVAPVSRFNIMLGRTLGGATIAFVQGCIILLLSLGLGFRPFSLAYLPLALLVMALIALLFTAIGSAIATRLEDMQAFPLIMNFFVMPLFFLSGALYPLDGLPHALTIVARFDPLTYGVDALRGALSGDLHFSYGLDIGIIVVLTVAVIMLGGWLFSKIEL